MISLLGFMTHPHPFIRLFVFLVIVGILASLIAAAVIMRWRRREALNNRLKTIEEKLDRLNTLPPR